MDFVKSQIDRLQQQLSGLSASQKMLTGTLVTIMVMTLAYWARYAGTAEMEPVLNQAFADDQIAMVTSTLAAKQIPYRVEAGKILVPADRKIEVIADLGFADLLPGNTTSGFDEIVKQMNPFDPQSKTERMYTHAKELTLQNIIGKFPGVRGAQVMIDATAERIIGGGDRTPSASIAISLRPGGSDGRSPKRLVAAAVNMVSGAVSNLQKGKIRVTVDGAPVEPSADDPVGGDDAFERKRNIERAMADKVRGQLAYVPNALVTVTVELNEQSKTMVLTKVDPANAIVKPLEEDTSSHDSSTPVPSAAEPGVMSNSAVSVAPAASAAERSTETTETSKVKNTVDYGRSEEHIVTPAGKATVSTAAVSLPRSFFVGLFKQRQGATAKEPTQDEVDLLSRDELPRVREIVMKCLALKEADVEVQVYSDLLQAPAGGAPAVAETATLPLGMASHLKEIAVGGLAVVSLFMVMSMVRKAAPPPVVAAAVEFREPSRLIGGEALAGEAAEGGATLDAMELDDDAVKAQQMLDQVQVMVKDNPDAAATLVKRWMSRA